MELTRASNPIMHFDDDKGHPLADGFLFTYEAGTSKDIATYKSKDGAKNPVKIQLDSRGECEIWLDPKKSYKFILKSADGSYVREEDNVTASAHVKATIPFAIDEEDFEMNSIAGALVLSLRNHNVITNTSELVNDGDGTSKFLTEEKANGWVLDSSPAEPVAETTTTWNDTKAYYNRALGLCLLQINVYAKVDGTTTLANIFTNLKYKPLTTLNYRVGNDKHVSITSGGVIQYFDRVLDGSGGSFLRFPILYPYKVV